VWRARKFIYIFVVLAVVKLFVTKIKSISLLTQSDIDLIFVLFTELKEVAFLKFIYIKFFGRVAPQPVGQSPVCHSCGARSSSGAVCLGFVAESGPDSSPDDYSFPLSVGCHPTDSTNYDTCDMTLSFF